MRRKTSWIAGLLSTLALIGVTASTAQAAPPRTTTTATEEAATPSLEGQVIASSCYGGAQRYSKPGNQPLLMWFTTSNRCNDINLRPNTNRYVKVCFGTRASDCQANWTLAKAGQWNAIATNVLPGTRYMFWFRSDAASSGSIAH
ncbi:hypothetical protein [Streptomyces bohaiensis]|uniref:Secreted protein n=1 Tax=Streptomyces bohaiensis TaxID=1431344 RepID=A0ABX1CH08_9ACTN|nr:hypothetical protein [Streptomyces bohaiensis]NJQ17170.1 hypothetical protein [Streptomyces bohaiensis]